MSSKVPAGQGNAGKGEGCGRGGGPTVVHLLTHFTQPPPPGQLVAPYPAAAAEFSLRWMHASLPTNSGMV